jgi:DNA-binding NarL/FixJ family response regulator
MRIILADSDETTLWALRVMLQEEASLEIVGEAPDAPGLQKTAEENKADLILMDRKLPGGPIETLIRELHAHVPRPIVVVMSSSSEDSRLAIRAGADAFVSKGDEPEWLLETLRHFAKRPLNGIEPL